MGAAGAGRLRAAIPYGHRKTATFVAALRINGIAALFVFGGPINRSAFEIYVEKVLIPELRPGDIVVTDNLSSHKGAVIGAMIEAADSRLLFLPTAPTSIRSKKPFQNSRRIYAKPQSEPSVVFGTPSAASSMTSCRKNAPTSSLRQVTMQSERKTL
jgi:hypothetical protein